MPALVTPRCTVYPKMVTCTRKVARVDCSQEYRERSHLWLTEQSSRELQTSKPSSFIIHILDRTDA